MALMIISIPNMSVLPDWKGPDFMMVPAFQTSAVQCVLDAKAKLGECPRWDPVSRRLYWVDIKSCQLHVFDPTTGADDYITFSEEIGCFALRESGGFIAGMRGGFALIDSLSMDPEAIRYIGDPEADKPDNRFNDGRCDGLGRFWAGTINEKKSASDGMLYKCDLSHQITDMTGGVFTSNGLAFSPDHKILYYSDTPRHVIYAFDFDLPTGSLSNKRLFYKFPEGQGRPDGAAVDSDGNYWTALYDGASIACLSPNGQLLEQIEIPAQHCTMLAFGGPDLKTLYITTARDGLTDSQLQEYPQAGGIFAVDVRIAGLPEMVFKG